MTKHTPVLLTEVLTYLMPRKGQHFIDCTINGGGHAKAILERTAPTGKLLGIDLDKETLKFCQKEFGQYKNLKERIILVNDNFKNLKKIYEQKFPYPVSGILFDLGLSTLQLSSPSRGFSFQREGPLDMRFSRQPCQLEKDDSIALSAVKIINRWPREKIAEILKIFSQEKDAEKIAAAICRYRRQQQIKTTKELAEIILEAKTNKNPHARRALTKIHPATKTFQALRIAVNDELNNLRLTLPQALTLLQTNGRLVVISYHSLEDRIVKLFFRQQKVKSVVKILTPKPIRPSKEELRKNPKSRSAKLRAIVIT